MASIFGVAKAVTPHDSNDLDVTASSLYIGGSGDVNVILEGQKTAVLFKAHPIGYLPGRVTRVLSTNTTATNILALSS